MPRTAFAEVNERLLRNFPGLVQEWLPGGKFNGKEYQSKNPTRADSSMGSFSVNTQTGLWADFATNDRGGDPISLYAYLHGLSQGDALKELAGNGHDKTKAVKPQGRAAAADPWVSVIPVPDEVPEPDGRHGEYGMPHYIWYYFTATGGLVGAVCRWDIEGQKKILPIAYFKNTQTGKSEWRWKHWAKPRGLYNLDRLSQLKDAPVWVVEGEKCAEELTDLFPDCVVVTWPGGAAHVKYADWEPLTGRKVYIWPDNDDPGQAAKAYIYSVLRGKAKEIHRYIIPEDKPQGWDCFDAIKEGATRDAILAATVEMREMPGEGPAKPVAPPDPAGRRWPFRFLGYDHGDYFYQSYRQNQVITLSANAHNRSNLLTLAPLQFWETEFPDKQGPDWAAAMDEMIGMQVSDDGPGPYNPSMLCGRGVCWDDGRVVVHLGSKLVVDGEDVNLAQVRSKHIYESASPPLRMTKEPPLSAKEAEECFKLIDMLTWEKPRYAAYLAGWIMLAPICGALRWRPHLWNTGTAGSGKTWVGENITRRILGDWSLHVQGGVTEAGIRQKLNNDLLPVICDEAEQENKAQAARIDSILFLMRQASSDSGAQVIKGSTTGRAITYNVRSMFLFSSISVGARYHADNSRISVITLQEDIAGKFGDVFERIKETTFRLLTRQYCDRMVKRSIAMLPTIKKNADTLADAVAKVLRSKRTGDQVGALLAGKLAMVSDEVLTQERAEQMVSQEDWSEERVSQDQRDEYMCLKAILQATTKVQLEKSSVERNIGELIAVASGEADSLPELTRGVAHDALRRFGVRVEDCMVHFSNTSRMIQNALKDTAYGHGHHRQLRRILGSETGEKVMRFNPGMVSRYVSIPISTVMDDERLMQAGEDKNDAGEPVAEPAGATEPGSDEQGKFAY